MNPKSRSLFSGFAGVALADILANGVTIIIIMIVVVMMIKHEQEQEKIEQAEEVSILLSRKIASSVVMNAIPASSPARLHDYHTSRLDLNPQHAIMPIIELHRDYARNFYNGEIFSRDELLKPSNRLDAYIRSLSRTQLRLMRVDIYHVNLFYIVMSILKDYNHSPRHWHFLTYPPSKTPGEGGNQTLAQTQAPDKPGLSADELSSNGSNLNAEAGESDINDADSAQDVELAAEQAGQAGQSGQSQTPQNVSLSLAAEGNQDYPYDDLAFEAGGRQTSSELQDPADLPGASDQKSEQQETSDAVFDALAEMMASNENGNFQRNQGNSRVARFRNASGEGNNESENEQNGDGNNRMRVGESVDMAAVLRALFAFMEQAQKKIDAGEPFHLANYNFKRDVIDKISALKPLRDPQQIAFFYALARIIENVPHNTDEALSVSAEESDKLQGKIFSARVNQRLTKGALLYDPMQMPPDDLPAQVSVTSRAGLYPEIYKGVRLPLKAESLILTPPRDKSEPYRFGWKIATFVNPEADDFVTAFVYAAFDEKGTLLLASDENAIKISSLRVETYYPPLPLRKEKWQILLYGLAAALVTLSIVRRFRKTV